MVAKLGGQTQGDAGEGDVAKSTLTGDGMMATQQQPSAGKSALDALDRLQVSLRERRVDLAEWAWAVRVERVGKGKEAMNKKQALTLLRAHKAILVQRFRCCRYRAFRINRSR